MLPSHRSPGSTPSAAPFRAGRPAHEGLPGGLPADVHRLAADAGVGDAELVRRTREGQEDAFAALVARYEKRAFWVAFHVVGRVEDARDVAQEAFVRLFRSLDRYDFARSFYTWFYRIVMNLAIDQLRKIRSARSTSIEDFVSAMTDEREPLASQPLERAEEDRLVWSVLEKLDPRLRAVLVLRDIHGLSCREIAPILRVTHATARWRLHRGRQVFREHWERREHGERPGETTGGAER